MRRIASLFIIFCALFSYIYADASTDMYIVGTMNNWQITDGYKMTETVAGKEWTFDFGAMDIEGQRFMIKVGSETGTVNLGACSPVPSLQEGFVPLLYNACSIQLADRYSGATNVKFTLKMNGDVVSSVFTGDFVEKEGYVPEKKDTISSSVPSGTLPVLRITTDKVRSIVDGDVNHDSIAIGTCYIEEKEIKISATPDTIKIQGRGNYTWQSFDKKPYKLKFSNSVSPLGLPKGKDFALMASAEDVYSFLRNTVGQEVSRRMNMPWTPSQQPVEVVWNDEYLGLYMLSETVKAGKLNISEQADSAVDKTAVTGGWLVEIDNNADTPQLTLNDDGNPAPLRITGKYPSAWSLVQEDYLKDQWKNIYESLSTGDWETTAKYLDIDAAARFYIIQEITDNREAYNGSCYLYKDIDSTSVQSKWIFGPVWDFGCTFCSYEGAMQYIWEDYAFNAHIINYLHNDPDFMESVKSQWRIFKGNNYEGLDVYIHNFFTQIASAAKSDAARWPLYDHSDVTASENAYMEKLKNRIGWLTEQWGEGTPTGIEIVNETQQTSILTGHTGYYTLQGIRVEHPVKGGLYIHDGKKMILH